MFTVHAVVLVTNWHVLYLTQRSDSPEYLEELRFEPTDRFDWHALRGHAGRFENRKLKRAVELLSRMATGKSAQEL